MIKRLFLFTILCVAALTGCNKKADPVTNDTPYYQYYEVTYDKTRIATTATAVFRKNDSAGAKVQLQGASYLKINNTLVTPDANDLTHYTWTDTGFGNVSFMLVKNDEKAFYNSATLVGIKDVTFMPNFPGTFKKANGIYFSWLGDLADSAGDVIVSIKGRNANDTNSYITLNWNTDVNYMQIQPTEIAGLKTGPITITVARSELMAIDAYDGNAGGQKKVTLSESRTVTLNP